MAETSADSRRKVLVVGEDSAWPDAGTFQAAGAHPTHVADTAAVVQTAEEAEADLVLLGEDLPPRAAAEALTDLRRSMPDLPVIVIRREAKVDEAVEFVRRSAHDYLAGPLSDRELRQIFDGLDTEEGRDGGSKRFFCDDCPPGVAIAGRSDGLIKALETIRIIAESRCNPVLILGETGTGKELAARAVHAWRCGDGEPFVAVNCAALTANLLESELFGHVRGAFTGADRSKEGLFAQARTGTIFLDEISEMPLELQAKLLRVLQERRFRKVGGNTDLPCNATIIASSNRDLSAEIEAGRFRRDLYYRLAVFPVTLPTLRSPERRKDIPLLAEYFLQTSDLAVDGERTLGAGVAERLARHTWPGNVRELRNVMERALILARGGSVTPECILLKQMQVPAAAGDGPAPEPDAEPARDPEDFSLETAEREFILRALKETGWQRTRAAALLGITRATLHSKLKRYGLKPPDARSSSSGSSTDSREAAVPAGSA